MDMKAGPIPPGVSVDQARSESPVETDLAKLKACAKDFQSNPTKLVKIKFLTTVIGLFIKFDLSVPQKLQDNLKKQVGKLCQDVSPGGNLLITASTAFKAASLQPQFPHDTGGNPTPRAASQVSSPKPNNVWKAAYPQIHATALTPEEKDVKKSEILAQHGVINKDGIYSKTNNKVDPHELLNAQRDLKFVLQVDGDKTIWLNYRSDPQHISHARIEINDDGSLEIGYRIYGSIEEFIDQQPINQVRSYGVSRSAFTEMFDDKNKKFALEEGNDKSLWIYTRTDTGHIKPSRITFMDDGKIEVAYKSYANFEEFLEKNNLK